MQQTLVECANTFQSRSSTGHGYRARCEVRDARVRAAAGADESPALRLFQYALATLHGLEPNSGLASECSELETRSLMIAVGPSPK